MEFFATIIKAFQPLTIFEKKLHLIDVWLGLNATLENGEKIAALTESKRWYYACYICCASFRPITLRGYFRIKYIKSIISVYRNIKILSIYNFDSILSVSYHLPIIHYEHPRQIFRDICIPIIYIHTWLHPRELQLIFRIEKLCKVSRWAIRS